MTTASDHQMLPSPPPPPPYTYPPIIIILSILILIVFFVGFFSIYFCNCCLQNLCCMARLRGSATATPVPGAASAAASHGLDPSIVQSFPSFIYSTVQDYRLEKYGLECAICLLEFKPTDLLRLLTTCCHVFHQECIDLWLQSHSTCPVCRKNLMSPPHQNEAVTTVADHQDHPHVSFNITIRDENEEKGTSSGVDKYPRSHSTGHSIRNKGNTSEEDRFTLRLPHHVKSRIIKGHNTSKSWSVFGEYCKEKDSSSKTVAQFSGDNNV